MIMKYIFSFSLFFLCTTLVGYTNNKKQEIIACGGDEVIIIDYTESTGDKTHVIWNWNVKEATDLPEIYRNQYLIPLDDCKPVDNNTRLLLTSSSGGVTLLDKETRKSLFYAYAPMAHSAEMLPNNRIAVALSTHPEGNSLELYNIDNPEKVIWKDSLYSGHGVVWVQNRQLLFALGFNDLRAYSLKNWESNEPELVLEKKWIIPSEGGHDLTRISDNELIVTGHENTWTFSIETEQFSVFEPLANIHNVKSVNYNPSTGQLIYTKAETSWWTHNIYCENPERIFNIPEIELYKARVYSE